MSKCHLPALIQKPALRLSHAYPTLTVLPTRKADPAAKSPPWLAFSGDTPLHQKPHYQNAYKNHGTKKAYKVDTNA